MDARPLPVLETLYKSVAYVWYLRKRLAVALLPTFCALVFIDFVSEYISRAGNVSPPLLVSLLSLPLTILYTVTVHRIMILGPDATARYGVFEWKIREWRFLLYSIGLGIVSGILLLILFMVVPGTNENDRTLFDYALMFFAGLPAAFVFARFSLVFPAIAVDADLSFMDSWEISKGSAIELTVVVFSVPILSFLFTAALFNILPEQVKEIFDIYLTIAGILVNYVLWAIEISCLSFSYRYLVENSD